MATTTPNFGWPVPTSTDLVKDGATAIEALGDSIDASLLDLKGGTSGQVLSKNSNTDMDFTWVTSDDANAIQNTIVDAKGDLIAATAADTPARLAVGTNGQVLTADSTAATGLAWAAAPSSGGLTLISTTSLTSTTTTISATLTSYKNVFMLLKMISASTTTDMKMRMNSDTGSNYSTNIVYGTGSTAAGRSSNAATSLVISNISVGTTARAAVNGSMNVYRVNDTNEIVMDFTTRNDNNSDYRTDRGCGVYDNTAAISSFTFFLDSGTFTGGTIYLYGVN
jgi:hypothetical protein